MTWILKIMFEATPDWQLTLSYPCADPEGVGTEGQNPPPLIFQKNEFCLKSSFEVFAMVKFVGTLRSEAWRKCLRGNFLETRILPLQSTQLFLHSQEWIFAASLVKIRLPVQKIASRQNVRPMGEDEEKVSTSCLEENKKCLSHEILQRPQLHQCIIIALSLSKNDPSFSC